MYFALMLGGKWIRAFSSACGLTLKCCCFHVAGGVRCPVREHAWWLHKSKNLPEGRVMLHNMMLLSFRSMQRKQRDPNEASGKQQGGKQKLGNPPPHSTKHLIRRDTSSTHARMKRKQ